MNDDNLMNENPSDNDRRSGIQVIARAALILRTLEDETGGLSLNEIAARVSLARSTVQRIVAALVDEQMLIAASPKSRVKLGPALIRLAKATNINIEHVAHPIMESICREINETIDLSIVQGKSAVFIDQVLGNNRLQTVSAIGDRFPLHSTACGKALLSELPQTKVNKILEVELERFTVNTITDTVQLREQIEKVKNGDVAVDFEEHTEGICALGIAFRDPFNQVFAISMPVPTNRFKRNQDRIQKALLECRHQIVSALGEIRKRD